MLYTQVEHAWPGSLTTTTTLLNILWTPGGRGVPETSVPAGLGLHRSAAFGPRRDRRPPGSGSSAAASSTPPPGSATTCRTAVRWSHHPQGLPQGHEQRLASWQGLEAWQPLLGCCLGCADPKVAMRGALNCREVGQRSVQGKHAANNTRCSRPDGVKGQRVLTA